MKTITSFWFITIVGIALVLGTNHFCNDCLKMSLDDSKAVTLAVITLFACPFVWGKIFVVKYKRKLLAWVVFLLFVVFLSFLQFATLTKGVLPIPPTGLAAMDDFYEILFGGAAILISHILMKFLDGVDSHEATR